MTEHDLRAQEADLGQELDRGHAVALEHHLVLPQRLGAMGLDADPQSGGGPLGLLEEGRRAVVDGVRVQHALDAPVPGAVVLLDEAHRPLELAQALPLIRAVDPLTALVHAGPVGAHARGQVGAAAEAKVELA